MSAQPDAFPPPLPAPAYLGSANAWECDEGGHLNVRFQLERAMAGLAHVAAALEMRNAFSSDATATLLPLDMHIRFLKEARPGEALEMHAGVLEFSESEARICLDMRHGGENAGAPASAFTIRVAHVEARSLKAFGWSARSRAAAARIACQAPAHAQPRSIDVSASASGASLARAIELGAARIGGFVASPDQCDAFGRMRAEFVMARISDAIPNLLSRWRAALKQDPAYLDSEPAGAVLEARILFRRWPRAGDLIEVRSGLVEVAEKTFRVVHWLLNPQTGAAWASVEAVAVTFDSKTRKTMVPSAQARAAAAAQIVKGLKI